jgi:hypothetical protein
VCSSSCPIRRPRPSKFTSGEIDALDRVKPEDYKTYADGAAAGGYTLYDDRARASATEFFWFNLNKVRDPVRARSSGAPTSTP